MIHLEIAHVYGDQTFSREHEVSVIHAIDVISRYGREKVIVSVLVDDLHVDHNSLDIEAFCKQIGKVGVVVDQIVFEGRLDPVAGSLAARIDPTELRLERFKDHNALGFYERGRFIDIARSHKDSTVLQPSCASLAAAYHLCRLGEVPFPEGSMVNRTNSYIYGSVGISILQAKYMRVESKVHEILKAAGKTHILPQLDHRFFSI